MRNDDIDALLRGLRRGGQQVEPFPTLLYNPHRQVFKVSMADSDEVILQRYAASIWPVTTREGRTALACIMRHLLAAVHLARQERSMFFRWEESDFDGCGVVSEERMNRKDEDSEEEIESEESEEGEKEEKNEDVEV